MPPIFTFREVAFLWTTRKSYRNAITWFECAFGRAWTTVGIWYLQLRVQVSSCVTHLFSVASYSTIRWPSEIYLFNPGCCIGILIILLCVCTYSGLCVSMASLILLFKIVKSLLVLPNRCQPQPTNLSYTRANNSLKLAQLQSRFSYTLNTPRAFLPRLNNHWLE